MDRELNEMSTQWRRSMIEAGRKERENMTIFHLLKRGIQICHGLLALGFVILALVEFSQDPPYFDAIGGHTNGHGGANTSDISTETFRNLTTHGEPGGVRRIMDLPILLLFLSYFIVLLWRGAWGVWSFLMTFSMIVILLVFVIVNYWARHAFEWKFFGPRGYGVLIEVFCFALGWNCVAIAAFVKIEWYPFIFINNRPVGYCAKTALVLWNFFVVLFFLFFCLLIWFSRLYYSWACVESLGDVLLMCQFTNHVQCYACMEAATCTHLDVCVKTVKKTFHCQTPLAGLHDVNNAFCIFNYNIGFFTFVMVFAYVGGIYFFLSAVANFCVRALRLLARIMIKFMHRKTHPHIERFKTYSFKKKRCQETDQDTDDTEEEQGLLQNEYTVNDDASLTN